MIKVTFLGTGEACDRERANTSLLMETNSCTCLLDCGFSTPHRLLAQELDCEQLDMVWISHLHGDHYFGLPQLLLHFYEQKRSRPLLLLSGVPMETEVRQAMELAYPGILAKIGFCLDFQLLEPGQSFVMMNVVECRVAASRHSLPSYGIRIQTRESSLYYSGDGKATKETEALMADCKLIVHEAFTLEEQLATHGSVAACLELARTSGCSQMALVHLARESRVETAELARLLRNTQVATFLPNDGDILNI